MARLLVTTFLSLFVAGVAAAADRPNVLVICGDKNHLGDRDEHLPTAHGFDEFFGSLYHLNAEEEPENPDYFKDPEMRKRFATRGVLHSWANPDGTQKIELTGPLNRKRMETVDEEFTRQALRFMDESKKENKPF